MAHRNSNESKSRVAELKNGFARDLEGIASHIAHHEHAARISKVHVERAFQILSLSGLARRRLLDRPEVETGLGSFSTGMAFACPQAIAKLAPLQYRELASNTFFCVFMLVGIFLLVHGWFRGKLPTAPQAITWKTWVRRILLAAIALLLISSAAYFGFDRLAGQRSDCDCDCGVNEPDPAPFSEQEPTPAAPGVTD